MYSGLIQNLSGLFLNKLNLHARLCRGKPACVPYKIYTYMYIAYGIYYTFSILDTLDASLAVLNFYHMRHVFNVRLYRLYTLSLLKLTKLNVVLSTKTLYVCDIMLKIMYVMHRNEGCAIAKMTDL